jgi:hypothetical protein
MYIGHRRCLGGSYRRRRYGGVGPREEADLWRRNYSVEESPCSRASVPRGEATAHIPANRQSFSARHKGLGGSAERWRSDSGNRAHTSEGKENVVDEGRRERSPGATYVLHGEVRSLAGFEDQILQSRVDRISLQRIDGWGFVRYTADLWRSWPSGFRGEEIGFSRNHSRKTRSGISAITSGHRAASQVQSRTQREEAGDPPDGWGPGVSTSRRTSSAGTLVGQWATGIPSWAE